MHRLPHAWTPSSVCPFTSIGTSSAMRKVGCRTTSRTFSCSLTICLSLMFRSILCCGARAAPRRSLPPLYPAAAASTAARPGVESSTTRHAACHVGGKHANSSRWGAHGRPAAPAELARGAAGGRRAVRVAALRMARRVGLCGLRRARLGILGQLADAAEGR